MRSNELVFAKAHISTLALVNDDQSVNNFAGPWAVSAGAFLNLQNSITRGTVYSIMLMY